MNFLFTFLFLTGCWSSCSKSQNNDSTILDVEEVNLITWDECANELDNHACNFTLINQDGYEISLYDYVGSPILLDFSTEWCGVCKIAAEDLKRWAVDHGIENDHIFSADKELIDPSNDNSWPLSGYPTFFMIDELMVIRQGMVGYHPTILRDMIESVLSED